MNCANILACELLFAGGLLAAQVSTTTTLSVSPSSSQFGQSVTITATVAPSTASGSVSFYDEGAYLGDGRLNNGAAQLATSMLTAGHRSLYAIYGGSTTAGYASSRSATAPFTVTSIATNFSAPTTYATAQTNNYFTGVADLNRDGRPDLVVPSSQSVYVYVGNGDGTFQPAVIYAAASATSVAFGDVNGDGKLDMVTESSLFIGNGDGTFQPAVSHGGGLPNVPGAVKVEVGDFNNDGNADLIIGYSQAGNGQISVLLGNGDGTFQAPVAIPYAGYGGAFAIGDFNGDGKTDFVVMYPMFGGSPTSIEVFLGAGDGTFAASFSYAWISNPLGAQAVAVFDIDGDGRPDILLPAGPPDQTHRGGLVVLLGNGNGTFQNPLGPFPAGSSPDSVAFADINGDGKPDAILTDYNAMCVTVVLGNGDGTFQAPSFYYIGQAQGPPVVADFNGDGKPDIASTLWEMGKLNVFLGAGPVLPTSTTLAVSPNPVQLGASVTLTANVTPANATGIVAFYDGVTGLGFKVLNGSGTAQIQTGLLASGTHSISAVYTGALGYFSPSQSAVEEEVVNAVSASSFSTPVTYAAGSNPDSIAVADFDHDGNIDLAIGNANGLQILLGNSDGTFRQGANYPVGTIQGSMAVQDFDGDGNQDLAVAISGQYLFVMLGNGDGTFHQVTFQVGGLNNHVASGDFNGDGIPDLVVEDSANNEVQILEGNGNGTFQQVYNGQASSGGSGALSVVVGDFNGDGKADLAISNNQSNTVGVLLGYGDFLFQLPATYSVGTNPEQVAVGDFNGDGKADLAVANFGSNNVSVLLGNGDGTFQTAVNYPAGGGPMAIVTGDFNGDGKPDLAVANLTGNTVSLLIGNGRGTFQSPLNSPAGASPIALVAADFNRDSRTDLAVVNYTNTVSILLGTAATHNVSVGVYRPTSAVVALDINSNLAWDPGTDLVGSFGLPGDIVITGDWTGTGTTKIGIFRPSAGLFALDINGNGIWDPGIDTYGYFGFPGDVPVVGDWTGTGTTKVGIYRPSDQIWALDVNGNLAWDQGIDASGQFGLPGDLPVVGDWNGDHRAKIGIFRPSNALWALDTDGSVTYTPGDAVGFFGLANDTPVVGDWTGSGTTKAGIFRSSTALWALDVDGSLSWTPGVDTSGSFGFSGDTPVVGDWNGSGKTKVGIFRPSDATWALNIAGNLIWSPPTDHSGQFGLPNDTPIIGNWK